ncbi:WXG100 family type VII secretion target [Bacillus wiedmannii]|uniref:WXG100 family type VII secretion target n=2 Tax=Bacillus cereus group TaxID=86661 RepID=UPI000B4523A5|nr:WXG100 family type VII secretion target [Bacillus wiedmannii]OUB85763.1 type VII secretion protein [Bacillus thuringiensis serovar sinensis]
MVQIKVTPEMLEEVANRASNTRIALESIHNNLCNEIDQLCFQWIGASNQQFIQMFNDARPKAFTAINSIIQVEEDLKRIAEKFRNADDQDVTMEEGAMCGKPSSEEKGFDSGKLARDITGELTGEYDIRRVWDGIDPSTGEKLSGWERAGAGFMAVAGLTPFGKLAKVGKGVKMTAKATEAVNTAKKVPVGKASGTKSIISSEMEEKILLGQRKNPNKNEIIGGHSSNIKNSHPNYATETIKVNPNGTKDIKYTTQFPDGKLAKIKNSTIFPDSWSDTKILDSITDIGNSSPLGIRGRDGATFHREIIDGVEIDVIKIGDNVVSGYPTGQINAPLPGGFTK